jgi:hypothetical protein
MKFDLDFKEVRSGWSGRPGTLFLVPGRLLQPGDREPAH